MCMNTYLFLGMHYCLYVIQHSMAVLMVLILDGISPGLTHQGILWTHSGVQVESTPEVTYKYIYGSYYMIVTII